MAEENEKIQKDFMDNIRKMMSQGIPLIHPEPDHKQEETEPEAKQKRNHRLEFNFKPRDIKNYLDRFVIKQEDAKRVLATAVCDHYNHVKKYEQNKSAKYYFKQNVIMLGPTGVGKTHLVRHLAELIGVPLIKADATKFSETGYVGGDVEDLIRNLVQKADGDIELAQYGIVYLDEVDKIATYGQEGIRDVSGSGVQRGLLKMMEETEVSLRNPQDIQSQIQSMMEFQKKGKVSKPTINTRHILFIVSGAFDGLAPVIKRRLKNRSVGFTVHDSKPDISKTHWLEQSQTEDFIQFGFESEFIGRLPVRVVCHPLSQEDLYQILSHSEDSILHQYQAAFEAYGIQMHLDPKALWEIAKLASLEKTGARGLLTVCERIFRHLKYELPSSRLKEFTLTEEMVLHPQCVLEKLLAEERLELKREIGKKIKLYENAYFAKNNLRIEFTEDAISAISEQWMLEKPDLNSFLDKLLINYKFGLELILKKKTQDSFLLDRHAIENPNALLDQWIKETYENR